MVCSDDGTFTSSYATTVTNASLVVGPVIAGLANTPRMPAGTCLHGVRILEKGTDAQGMTLPGGNDAIDTFSGPITLIRGDTGESLVAVPRAGAGGSSRIFTTRTTFTIRENTPGYSESDFQCDHQRADGKPSDLINTIAIKGDTDGEGNNRSCLSADGKLKLSKEATAQPSNGSTFDAVYTVGMVNERSLTVSTGPISDEPSSVPGFNLALVKV